MLVIIGFSGIVVDLGCLVYAQRTLQISTDMAALAGAQDVNVGSGRTAIATATAYSAVTGQKNAHSNLSATMASGYPRLNLPTSTGISCSGPASANPIVMREQATVPLSSQRCSASIPGRSRRAQLRTRGGQVQPLVRDNHSRYHGIDEQRRYKLLHLRGYQT